MTEQQTHLQSAIQQQNVLLNEIQKLQTEIDNKRQLAVKAQGITCLNWIAKLSSHKAFARADVSYYCKSNHLIN